MAPSRLCRFSIYWKASCTILMGLGPTLYTISQLHLKWLASSPYHADIHVDHMFAGTGIASIPHCSMQFTALTPPTHTSSHTAMYNYGHMISSQLHDPTIPLKSHGQPRV